MKRSILVLVAVACVFCAVAQADTLTMTLDQNYFNAKPDSTISVTGTLTNNGNTDLAMFWPVFGQTPPNNYLVYPFTFEPFTTGIAAGATYTGELFRIVVAPGAKLPVNGSAYFEFYSLANPPACVNDYSPCLTGDLVLSNTVNFSVGDSPVSTVPEPASMTLLGTGILGVTGLVRRKFRK